MARIQQHRAIRQSVPLAERPLTPKARSRAALYAIDTIPITDQVARGLIPRERLRDLACDPFRGRICCDIFDPDKVSAGKPDDDDDEDIEQVKGNGRNPARWLRVTG